MTYRWERRLDDAGVPEWRLVEGPTNIVRAEIRANLAADRWDVTWPRGVGGFESLWEARVLVERELGLLDLNLTDRRWDIVPMDAR